MTDLAQFTEVPNPHIECRRWIPHPVATGDMVGTVGVESGRETTCALFLHRNETFEDDEREWKSTYNEQFEGYAISEWILDVIDRKGVEKVYIAVLDEERLMEFDLEQYQTGIDFEWREGDPQRCVPEADCRREWDASEVVINNPNTRHTDRLKMRMAEKERAREAYS